MTERIATISVFLACVAALGTLHLLGRRSEHVCDLATLFARLMATRATRVATVLAWAWIGWHFLVTPPI